MLARGGEAKEKGAREEGGEMVSRNRPVLWPSGNLQRPW